MEKSLTGTLPRVKLVMSYSGPMKELGDFVSSINLSYAKKWGILVHIERDVFPPEGRHPSWRKIGLLLDLMESYSDFDYLFWVDADSMICNHDFDIRTIPQRYPNYDLIVGTDDAGICLGNFLVKNTSWSHNILRAIDTLGPWKFEGSASSDGLPKYEQDTLKALCYNFQIMKRIKELPPRFINAYFHMGFTKGDFLIHAVCDPFDVRLRRLKEVAIDQGLIKE